MATHRRLRRALTRGRIDWKAPALVGLGVLLLALTVHDRQVAADKGDPNDPRPLWETHVVTGPRRAIAVYNYGPSGFDVKVGYAIGITDAQDPNWTWDIQGPSLARRAPIARDVEPRRADPTPRVG